MTEDFKIMNLFSRLVDILLLNFLFLLTSLPVITLGASITALFSVNLKLTKNEESYISRDYFRAFRQNFRLGTAGFLLFAVIAGLLCTNLWISYKIPGVFFLVLRALATIFLVFLAVWALYYFPILARFQFTWKQIHTHIPHMIVTHPGSFFLLLLLNIPLVFLSMYSVYTATFLLIGGCLFGFALLTYVESFVFRSIFRPYEIC